MRLRFKLGVPILGALVVSACAFPYYMQAIGGQVDLLRQRVPIEEAIADPGFDETTRRRLELVTELRRFAVSELGLPDNRSYTSYVDLGREYVVWNVVAAGEFSVDPVTWCFPIAGCVSYRGYFDRTKADAFAQSLSGKGYDTFTGGSAAYSTLGYFADPVLNTMLRRGDTNIAATLFHELAHQRLYVKDDTELSESFATTVEQYAVEEWFMHRDQPEALARYRARLERQSRFASLVRDQRLRLMRLFDSDLDANSMREAKGEAFELMHQEYESLKADWGGNGDYDAWFDSNLNNASLVAVTSYQRWVPGLRARLDAVGPEVFYDELEALVDREPDLRTTTLEGWNQASMTAVLADRR